MDTVQLVVHVVTRRGKHTLKDDRKWTEKFRPWTRQTDKDNSRFPLDSLTPGVSSDSGAWLPALEFECNPKLLPEIIIIIQAKKTCPPLESAQIPVLNIEKRDFLDWTEKLLGTDNRWEAHVAQQVPLPRTSSPFPSNN